MAAHRVHVFIDHACLSPRQVDGNAIRSRQNASGKPPHSRQRWSVPTSQSSASTNALALAGGIFSIEDAYHPLGDSRTGHANEPIEILLG